jgi:hypothetical protein
MHSFTRFYYLTAAVPLTSREAMRLAHMRQFELAERSYSLYLITLLLASCCDLKSTWSEELKQGWKNRKFQEKTK